MRGSSAFKAARAKRVKIADIEVGKEYEYGRYRGKMGHRVKVLDTGLDWPGKDPRPDLDGEYVRIRYESGYRKGSTETVPGGRINGTWAEAEQYVEERKNTLEEMRRVGSDIKGALGKGARVHARDQAGKSPRLTISLDLAGAQRLADSLGIERVPEGDALRDVLADVGVVDPDDAD